MPRYTREETENCGMAVPTDHITPGRAPSRDHVTYHDVDLSEGLQSRQDRIEKTLHQVRDSLDGLEDRLRPVLTDDVPSPSVDKPAPVEQYSNLAVWLAETLLHLQSVVDRIERLARRVDL